MELVKNMSGSVWVGVYQQLWEGSSKFGVFGNPFGIPVPLELGGSKFIVTISDSLIFLGLSQKRGINAFESSGSFLACLICSFLVHKETSIVLGHLIIGHCCVTTGSLFVSISLCSGIGDHLSSSIVVSLLEWEHCIVIGGGLGISINLGIEVSDFIGGSVSCIFSKISLGGEWLSRHRSGEEECNSNFHFLALNF